MLKLKLQYFGQLTWRTDSLKKTLMLGKTEGRRRRGQQRMRQLDAPLTRRTWVWASSGSWWWTGKPGMLQFMGSQRVWHDWATELSWTGLYLLEVSHCSVAKLCLTLQPHGLQHARLPCPSTTPRACSNSCSSSWWCHPTISFLSSPSPPAFNLFQHQGLFQWLNSSHQVAKVLELQHQSFQWIFRADFLYEGLVGSSCSPRDFQEASPTPQFKSINCLVLSFLYSPTLTSIHDYWKNHNFD